MFHIGGDFGRLSSYLTLSFRGTFLFIGVIVSTKLIEKRVAIFLHFVFMD